MFYMGALCENIKESPRRKCRHGKIFSGLNKVLFRIPMKKIIKNGVKLAETEKLENLKKFKKRAQTSTQIYLIISSPG